MNDINSCEYAERGEWGSVMECDHPKSRFGYCNKEGCPLK